METRERGRTLLNLYDFRGIMTLSYVGVLWPSLITKLYVSKIENMHYVVEH